MSNSQQSVGQLWQVDGVGTNSGVTVTKAAASGATLGQKHYIRAIQVSGDAAATVILKQGTTVIFTIRYAAAFVDSIPFPVPLVSAANALVSCAISASTSNSEANMQGYTAA